MDDSAKLEQILKVECPCISIVTQEEEYALEVIRNSLPLSVTMAEKMQALRHWARTRCVPAD